MEYGINEFVKVISPKMLYQKYKRKKIYKKNSGKSLLLGLGCGIHNVTFGNYVYIGSKVNLNNVEIGNHSYVNSNSRIRDTRIGKFCSIASEVKIVLGSHPMNLISTHPAFYSNNKAFKTFSTETQFQEYFPVEIGNDVWIGEEVMIPGGIKIGDGAVIASRSVVTKDVMPYSVVGGVPAKHIKYRFTIKEIELLLKFKWWDKDEEWLENNFKLFNNPELFINRIEKHTHA